MRSSSRRSPRVAELLAMDLPPLGAGRGYRPKGVRLPRVTSGRRTVYFFRRLLRDHPDIVDGLRNGTIKSINQALILVGLIKPERRASK